MASKEMSSENADDGGRTTDALLYYKCTYEPSTQLELSRNIQASEHEDDQNFMVCCLQTLANFSRL